MAFILRADTNAAIENGSASGNVLQNDTDAVRVTQVRAGAGTYVPVTSEGGVIRGVYGTLTIMADGSYVYAADNADRLRKGAAATDTFTYDSTGGGSSGSTTLRIALTGINDAPVLTSTTVALPNIAADQTANDGRKVSAFLTSTDVDSSTKGIAIFSLDSGNGHWEYSIDGRVSWSPVGTVSETSALLLRGADFIRFVPSGSGTNANFTFRAWDQSSGTAGGKGDASASGGETAFSTATGTASIVVGGGGDGGGTDPNQAPVATASSASGTEDGPPVTGQVQATDPEGSALTYALVANSAVGGSVSINASTGAYSFDSAPNFNGTASFRFTASDGSRTSSPAQVTISIAGVNDAPVAAADSGSTTQNTPVLLDVLANDSDVDGDPLSIANVGAASNGTVQIENGQVRYAPNAGFTGNDSFAYTISDGAGGTAQAIAAVSVGATSPPPSSSTLSLTFRQGANGYTGAVDTMLKQHRPTISFDDAAVLRPTTESGRNTDALLRFDGLFGTGPGQIPVGAQIISATLQLDVTGASASGGTLNRMLVSWDGSSTWNSLGNGVQTDGIEATSSGITVGAVALGSRVFNVLDSLAAWNAAGSTSAAKNAANLGWVFNPSGSDPWEFGSSQGAVQPILNVTYTLSGSAPSLPTVSISAAAPANEASGRLTFTLSLSQAATQNITVNVSTVDHTAKSGSDYVGISQSVTFLAGQTTRSFDVSLVNDGVGERLEAFTVQINSATNARINTAVATGKIVDNDVAVPAMPALAPTIVATHLISNGSRYDGAGSAGIADPSALAYVPTLGTLFIGDSEHDESPFNSTTNLFALGLNGSYLRNHSMTSFTREPTGLAYNPDNGLLYVGDDDAGAVSWFSPTNPSARLGFFDTQRLGFVDTEDLKFDPLTGNIHILDGAMRLMFELTPQGEFVNAVSLPSVMKNGEALAYDALHDLYFVAQGSALIWVMDAEGNLKATIDLLSSLGTRPKIKGMELAPSSNPNDGDRLSLYVTDYGSDQVNDGRLFEISLGPDWFT